MASVSIGRTILEVAVIVFDKDGTLIDFKSVWTRRANSAIEALAAEFPDADNVARRLRRGLGVDQDSGELLGSGPFALAPFSEIYCAATTVLYQGGLRWEDAAGLVRTVFAVKANATVEPHEIKPVGDVAGLMQALTAKGIKLAVATTDDRHATVETLGTMGCLSQIADLNCGDDTPPRKPDPALLTNIAQKLDCAIGSVLMVSDTRSDLLMATTAGAHFLGVLTGAGSMPDFKGADAIAHSVMEIQPA